MKRDTLQCVCVACEHMSENLQKAPSFMSVIKRRRKGDKRGKSSESIYAGVLFRKKWSRQQQK